MGNGVTIVIPTINPNYKFESLRLDQSCLEEVEILIVYQPLAPTKTEGTYERCDHENVRFITVDFRGTSKARNYGILKAKNDIIIFLDDDVSTDVNYVKFIKKAFSESDASLIIGRIFYGFHHKHEYSDEMKLVTSPLHANGSGSGISIRKSSLSKCNILFRENLGAGADVICGEDTAFCLDVFKSKLMVYKTKNYSCSHPVTGSTMHRRDAIFFSSYISVIKNHYRVLHFYILIKFCMRLAFKEGDLKSLCLLLRSYILSYK
jgi:glycosyltransferase involved in cell wall biosynthesis